MAGKKFRVKFLVVLIAVFLTCLYVFGIGYLFIKHPPQNIYKVVNYCDNNNTITIVLRDPLRMAVNESFEFPLLENDFQEIQLPVKKIILSEMKTATCESRSSCRNRLENEVLEESKRAFNFFIGNSYDVFQGYGFNATDNSYRNDTIRIALFGSSNIDKDWKLRLKSLQVFLHQSILDGKISSDYTLYPESTSDDDDDDTNGVFEVVSKWCHYYRRKHVPLVTEATTTTEEITTESTTTEMSVEISESTTTSYFYPDSTSESTTTTVFE